LNAAESSRKLIESLERRKAMVTRNKSKDVQSKEGRVEIGKLKLNRETVKDLTTGEAKDVKGGFAGSGTCPSAICKIPPYTSECPTRVPDGGPPPAPKS
jgi:hypothetical protein